MAKRIAFFCIPAHGHTNPMLPVAAELVNRGNKVRFYSFGEFEEKINKTGAEFVSCDAFLAPLTENEEKKLKEVSKTEMTLQDIRVTVQMDRFLQKEFEEFRPDVVFSDSVCFWGKLNAWKHKVPLVVSTSTFAFNQLSSGYMKNSPKELADMIFGISKITRELKKLEKYGYHVKNALQLVASDNNTDSVVYTSRRFQPFSESFSEHYAFVGPSVFSKDVPQKTKERPLIYISMGTVINDRADFYKNCIEAIKDINADAVIACGNSVKAEEMGKLPPNIKVYPYVNQLEILSKADAFITHCGMNSVSESLYMATPLILYPQTNEQEAVARRALEMGAGVRLKSDSPEGIRKAICEVLNNSEFGKAAKSCSEDFRSCGGAAAAAEFIENAPHTSESKDILKELNRSNTRFKLLYWLAFIILGVALGLRFGFGRLWLLGLTAAVLAAPVSGVFGKIKYKRLLKTLK